MSQVAGRIDGAASRMNMHADASYRQPQPGREKEAFGYGLAAGFLVAALLLFVLAAKKSLTLGTKGKFLLAVLLLAFAAGSWMAANSFKQEVVGYGFDPRAT